MTDTDRIIAARAMLEMLTPLRQDCGLRCGAACCQADEDGQGGMLLFPGEEALYPGADWYVLDDMGISVGGRPLTLLTCDGTCPRGERPLACRVFPLTPVARDGGPGVALDARAWPVCPLMPHGMGGLSRDFVAAVRAMAALLWEDPACARYIEWLTAQQAAFTSL